MAYYLVTTSLLPRYYIVVYGYLVALGCLSLGYEQAPRRPWVATDGCYTGCGSERAPTRPVSIKSPAISNRTPKAIEASARGRLGERGRNPGAAQSTISTIVVLGRSTSILSPAILNSRICRKRWSSSRLRLASK